MTIKQKTLCLKDYIKGVFFSAFFVGKCWGRDPKTAVESIMIVISKNTDKFFRSFSIIEVIMRPCTSIIFS